MKGFAFPRRFKSADSLLATLSRNNRELLAFLNNFTVRFNSDGSTVTLPGDLSVAGTLSGFDWQPWTPTLVNLTKGDGTLTARYVQVDKLVVAYFHLVFGSTSAVSGSPTISTPVTAASATYPDQQNNVGVVTIYDSGLTNYLGVVRLATVDTFNLLVQEIAYAVLAACHRDSP